jgi:hypothetical protein
MTQNSVISIFYLLLTSILLMLVGCEPDDPQKEDVPELITKVTLTFSPTGGGSAITATATDPDGLGILPIEVDGAISLATNTSYTMTISLINDLADVSAPEHNVSDEVLTEGDEHMVFFSWTNNLFSNPSGDGNIDVRADAVNYNDEDANHLPIGLTTLWTTTNVTSTGKFKILLKHQPDLKSATSTSSSGETDLDVDFDISVN